jgi:glutaconate CoA-transferase, subunit A
MSKITTFDSMIELASGGGVIGFGGGGMQRKPMAAARAMARAGLRGLDLAALLGGPEVDMLIGLGRVDRLRYAYVGLDNFGMAPNFRRARQNSQIAAVEYSEATMLVAFEAAAKALPFLPTRFGLETDLLTTPDTPLTTFACPITGATLVAVPALAPALAVVHVNVADAQGNALIHSDAFADPLLVQASGKVVLTAERIVDDISAARRPRSTFISRLWVDHVIHAPNGAGLTALFPDHRLDLRAALSYARGASDPDWLMTLVEEDA